MPIDYTLYRAPRPADTPYISTQEMREGQKKNRALDAERAVQEGLKVALDETGSVNESNFRKYMSAKGFSDIADSALIDFMGKRQKATTETLGLATTLKQLVDLGYVDPARARELLNTSEKVIKTPTTSVKAPPTETGTEDIFGGSKLPSAPAPAQSTGLGQNEVLITPGQENVKAGGYALPEIPSEYDQKVVTSPAQAAVGFASNLMNFNPAEAPKTLEDPAQKEKIKASLATYTLPEIAGDARRIEETSRISGRDPNVSVDDWIKDKAISRVPPPIKLITGTTLEDMYKSQANYLKELNEYPSKLASAQADIIKELESGQTSRFKQEMDTDSNKRAKEQAERDTERLRLEKEQKARESQQQTVEYLSDSVPATEKVNIGNKSAAVQGINENLKELVKLKPIDPKWEPLKLALSKEIIIAFNLPVTEGVLYDVESKVKDGISLTNLLDTKDYKDIPRQALRAMWDNFSKGPEGIIYLGQAAQRFARTSVEGNKIKDRVLFNKYFPVYGETGGVSDVKDKTTPVAKPVSGTQKEVKGSTGAKKRRELF